jgi:hypothetical protein
MRPFETNRAAITAAPAVSPAPAVIAAMAITPPRREAASLIVQHPRLCCGQQLESCIGRPRVQAEPLRETREHHDRFEKAAPAHDWWDWYAAYLSAREQGRSPEQADAAADLYMKEAHGVVVSR